MTKLFSMLINGIKYLELMSVMKQTNKKSASQVKGAGTVFLCHAQKAMFITRETVYASIRK